MNTIACLAALLFVQDERSLQEQYLAECQKGQWSEAESTATRLIDGYSNLHHYYFRAWARHRLALGSSQYREWYLEHAEKDLDTAINLGGPGRDDYTAFRSVVRFERKDWSGSRSDADSVSSSGLKDHAYANVLYEGGAAAFMMNDFSDAEGRFARALEADGNHAPSYEGRGKARYRLGKYRSAASDLGEAIDRNQNRADCLYHRALCFVMLEDGTRCAEDAAASEREGYSRFHARYLIAEAKRQLRRYGDAMEACEEALAGASDAAQRSDAHALRARIRLERGDSPDEARADVNKALEASETSFARDMSAECFIRSGEIEESIPQLERARELAPEDFRVGLRLAWACQIAGESDRQIEILEGLYRRHSENAQVLTALAGAYSWKKARLSDALAQVDEALRLDPRNAEALYLRGLIRSSLGAKAQAVEDFRAALTVAADDWCNRLVVTRLIERLER